MPAKPGATVAVDIMSLFTSINTKLDLVTRDISIKADQSSLNDLQRKVTEIEVHGSNNAQEAAKGVKALEDQLGGMGWKILGALGMAILSMIGSVVLMLVKH